jgi:AGZA family xanthine/uracil permease-like MFS transporter
LTVVGYHGFGGKVSYRTAVTAVAIEGSIFFFLSVTGIRYFLIRLVPEPVRVATPAAIGAFLAHIGLQTSEGIGVVAANIATVVGLAGCPPDQQVQIVAFNEVCQANSTDCITSSAYTCNGRELASPTTWVGIMGLMIMATLLAYK